jgi:hypothetical protein
MTLYIFRYRRQWGTGFAGVAADSVTAAIRIFAEKSCTSQSLLDPTDLVSEVELPESATAGVVFTEFVYD